MRKKTSLRDRDSHLLRFLRRATGPTTRRADKPATDAFRLYSRAPEINKSRYSIIGKNIRGAFNQKKAKKKQKGKERKKD